MKDGLIGIAFTLATLIVGCGQSTAAPGTTSPPDAHPRPSDTASAASVSIPTCAQISIPSASPSPGAVMTPAATTPTITVTSADDGATVFLTTQQHLVVEVGSPGPAVWTGTPQGADVFWDAPQAPTPGPLYREGTATCPGGNAVAVFTAVGTGGTTVGATTDAPCFHSQPVCQMPQRGVEIYVVVRQPR